MSVRLSFPQHVAIIMDGNGRWAQKRGLPRLSGHQKGAQVLKDVVRACPDLGVQYLTVYAFSSENWRRPAKEISGIMALLQHYLGTEAQALNEANVRLKVIGDCHKFSPTIQKQILGVETLTAKNTGLHLQIALNYGGRAEILQAVQRLATEIQKGRLTPEVITEELFQQHFYAPEIPDPELLIRTSGEQRISNYLLWQLAYTELLFVEKLWPDFTPTDLERALDAYSKRERRFGQAA